MGTVPSPPPPRIGGLRGPTRLRSAPALSTAPLPPRGDLGPDWLSEHRPLPHMEPDSWDSAAVGPVLSSGTGRAPCRHSEGRPPPSHRALQAAPPIVLGFSGTPEGSPGTPEGSPPLPGGVPKARPLGRLSAHHSPVRGLEAMALAKLSLSSFYGCGTFQTPLETARGGA